MTVIIQDQEVLQLINVKDCIPLMELAMREYAEGIAPAPPRTRYLARSEAPGLQYYMNTMTGAVPGTHTAAVRIDSNLMVGRERAGTMRMEFPKPSARNWGFIILFSLDTAEPLAIIHDFSLSAIRVAATSALAVQRLARKNSRTVGLFGSGKQARYNLEAIILSGKFEQVRVYSPNREHRESFAEEMTEKLNAEIVPVPRPEDVVRGVDVVACCTNTNEPVFDGNLLEPGQFVFSIANTDVNWTNKGGRREVDETTFLRASRIVVNNRESVITDGQWELSGLIERGEFGWDKVDELGDIVADMRPGRENDEEILYYKSNTGMGVQWAASCALIHQRAVERGIGQNLPTEWFGTDLTSWFNRGYYPSS